jgi:hypothetical protein
MPLLPVLAALTACSGWVTPATTTNECPAWAKKDWIAPNPAERADLDQPGMESVKEGVETLDCDICAACYPNNAQCLLNCPKPNTPDHDQG